MSRSNRIHIINFRPRKYIRRISGPVVKFNDTTIKFNNTNVKFSQGS